MKIAARTFGGLIIVAFLCILAACSTAVELPGGHSWLVSKAAEDRSPFGTNYAKGVDMHCREQVVHWYKSNEYPREHCTYVGEALPVAQAETADTSMIVPAAMAMPVKQTRSVTRPAHMVTRTPRHPAPKMVARPVVAPASVVQPPLLAKSDAVNPAAFPAGGYTRTRQ